MRDGSEGQVEPVSRVVGLSILFSDWSRYTDIVNSLVLRSHIEAALGTQTLNYRVRVLFAFFLWLRRPCRRAVTHWEAQTTRTLHLPLWIFRCCPNLK